MNNVIGMTLMVVGVLWILLWALFLRLTSGAGGPVGEFGESPPPLPAAKQTRKAVKQ